MSDREIRRLERQWLATKDPADGFALCVARRRAGLVVVPLRVGREFYPGSGHAVHAWWPAVMRGMLSVTANVFREAVWGQMGHRPQDEEVKGFGWYVELSTEGDLRPGTWTAGPHWAMTVLDPDAADVTGDVTLRHVDAWRRISDKQVTKVVNYALANEDVQNKVAELAGYDRPQRANPRRKRRNGPDERIRRLEREAKTGDRDAIERLHVERIRAGDRAYLAALANACLVDRWRGCLGGPRLGATSKRERILQWLQWNDPNGSYLDDMLEEGQEPLTLDEAWECVAHDFEDPCYALPP